MALFGGEGWDEALALGSEEPYQAHLVVDEEPYLVPLLAADYRRREYLVVLTDIHRGRLYAATPGEARILEELDEEIPRVKRLVNIARHREDRILHYLKELERLVDKAWGNHPYQGIILLGPHEVLEKFRKTIPKRLAGRVVEEAPHSWAGNQPEICDHVREVVDAAISRRLEQILAEIGRRLEEGFAVAIGPQEVVVAMANGLVLELVLGPDPGDVASRCSGCRSLFVTHETNCPYCKSPCARTSLWQEILSRAMRHGVAVHFAPAEATGLVVPGGAAALLARDDPQWAPASSVPSEVTEA
ncbi:hypothetical protein [Singulisphaera sp. PoT]|uniref:baeRF10 domain-containing protein n=1 Tax=Singulisphaera sp. PoT TaxID=3411797 RepID=UPI003BF50B9B